LSYVPARIADCGFRIGDWVSSPNPQSEIANPQ